MDLITWVVVKNSKGETVADALVDSFKCENGLITISTREPQKTADIHPVVRSGGYPVIQDTKIPVSQISTN